MDFPAIDNFQNRGLLNTKPHNEGKNSQESSSSSAVRDNECHEVITRFNTFCSIPNESNTQGSASGRENIYEGQRNVYLYLFCKIFPKEVMLGVKFGFSSYYVCFTKYYTDVFFQTTSDQNHSFAGSNRNTEDTHVIIHHPGFSQQDVVLPQVFLPSVGASGQAPAIQQNHNMDYTIINGIPNSLNSVSSEPNSNTYGNEWENMNFQIT